MSARKRRFVRAVEAVLSPFVLAVDRLRRDSEPHDSEPRRILVMEYWNLGDVVMLTPFLRSLRIHYPAASITLVTSPKSAPLIENQGLVDEILTVRVPWAQHYSRWRKYNPFSRGWAELFNLSKFLRARRFDLAFTARADLRENFMLWLARVKRRIGYGFGGGGFLLTDPVIPDLQRPHFASRWLRLLEYLGKPALVRFPSLHVTQEEQRSARHILEQHGLSSGQPVIGIHPGARSATRQWGEANFLALAERLQAQFPVKFVWFQDPNRPLATTTRKQIQPLVLPLRQFMAVLSRCDLLICNDSGPMHIATALGVPVVAVFGPTEPAWFGPLGEKNRIISKAGFWCRPCFDYCIFDQPYCLRTISVESVLEASAQAVDSLLNAAKPRSRDNDPVLCNATATENTG